MLITRGTAVAAFAAYVIALALRICRGTPGQPRTAPGMARWWWTAGCAIFLVHVVCAFQFVHHWSHDHAYAATARQSAEVTGFNSGVGLYLNYAFTVLWLGDAAWWWRSPQGCETRSRLVEWLVQGFMAFLWFNATVVFGKGPARWAGAAACVVLGLCWWWRCTRKRRRWCESE